MNSALESKNQLQAEVQKLRRQIHEAEEKSQRAEAALKATEQRYRLLGDSAPTVFSLSTRRDASPASTEKWRKCCSVPFSRSYRS